MMMRAVLRAIHNKISLIVLGFMRRRGKRITVMCWLPIGLAKM
jgi:hypothetical protein